MTDVEHLEGVLDEAEDPVAIMSHKENSDPDSLGSAYLMGQFLEDYDLSWDFLSDHTPKRPENKILKNYLELDIKEMDGGKEREELDSYESIAIVDCNVSMLPKNVQKLLEGPEEYLDKVISLIDHHTVKDDDEHTQTLQEREGVHTHIDEDLGSAATIFINYRKERGETLDTKAATAGSYAVTSDTDDLMPDMATDEDYDAAKHVRGQVDSEALRQMRGTEYSRKDFDYLTKAWQNSEIIEGKLISRLGKVSGRETNYAAFVADELLKLKNVDTTAAYYIDDENNQIIASIRASRTEETAEEIALEAFGKYGSAGGRVGKAGAQIPLGIYERALEEEGFEGFTSEAVDDALWEALGKKEQKETEEEEKNGNT